MVDILPMKNAIFSSIETQFSHYDIKIFYQPYPMFSSNIYDLPFLSQLNACRKKLHTLGIRVVKINKGRKGDQNY